MSVPDYFAGTHLIKCEKCGASYAARLMLMIESTGWRSYDGGDTLCWLCRTCDKQVRTVIDTWLAREN